MMLTALTLLSTIPGQIAPPAATVQPPADRPPSFVFVAPFGIFIPADHQGMIFMIDAPGVAIEAFDPDAEIALGDLANVSERFELVSVQVARSGGLRAVTLHLPDLAAMMPGKNPVKYLTLRPDGSIEFAPATASDPARLMIESEADTGRVTIRPMTDDDTAAVLTVTNQPDGSAMFKPDR